VGLQDVVRPYHSLLTSLPATSQELPLCGVRSGEPTSLTGWLCNWYFQVK
jgi:hypothetical protein